MHLGRSMPYFSSNGYLSLQQQHPNSLADGVPRICHLVWNLRVVLSGNGTMWTMMGLWMLSKAPPVFLIHQRKEMKPFNSSGCLSLQHIIPFPMLREHLVTSNVAHFVCNLRVGLSKNSTMWPRMWLIDALWRSSHIHYVSKEALKRFNSNKYLLLQYIIPFSVQRGYPKSGILCAIWGSISAEMTQCPP